MQNAGTRSLVVIIVILIGVIAALCAFLTWKDGKVLTRQPFPVLPHSLRLFS
jgi:hypothetical protein